MQGHPYGRLQYSQQTINMYTQNQPLPPGQMTARWLIIDKNTIPLKYCGVYKYIFPQEVQV